VKCAVFVIDGQADWYVTPLMRAFASLKGVPKRALIGPWSHEFPDWALPGPRIDGQRETLKWFDQFLKGEDSGVLREPPVTIWVREYRPPSVVCIEDKGTFRSENEWPIARAREESLPLVEGSFENRPDVGMTAGWHGCGPFPPWGMPLDQRPDEVHSLCTTTEPLTDGLGDHRHAARRCCASRPPPTSRWSR
jgi:predicted acyl esterase